MKRSPWFPLDANFQDDPAILEVSFEAEGVFVRSVALVKRTSNKITPAAMRKLCDKLDRDERGRLAIASELVAVALWEVDEDFWTIRAYESWNGDADAAAELSAAWGVFGAHRKHHVNAGKVKADCYWCQHPDETPAPKKGGDEGTSSPPSSPPSGDPSSPPKGGSSSIQDQTRPDQTRKDQTRKENPSPSTATPRAAVDNDGDEIDLHVAAQRIIRQVTPGGEPTSEELTAIGTALNSGWQLKHLIEKAFVAKRNGNDPRAYLRTALKTAATIEPPAPDDQPHGKAITGLQRREAAALATGALDHEHDILDPEINHESETA